MVWQDRSSGVFEVERFPLVAFALKQECDSAGHVLRYVEPVVWWADDGRPCEEYEDVTGEPGFAGLEFGDVQQPDESWITQWQVRHPGKQGMNHG